MTVAKFILGVIVVLSLTFCSNGKRMERTFAGHWAETLWIFSFYKDGTYKRTAAGHYGNSEVTGKYKVNGNTVELLSGYQDSDGTINQFYTIDKDSFLVDLKYGYDYRLQIDTTRFSYTSKIRTDIVKTINSE